MSSSLAPEMASDKGSYVVDNFNVLSSQEPSPSEVTALDSPLDVLNNLSSSRKLVILVVLCFSIFLDAANTTALFPATPVISSQLTIPDSQSVWIISAYQLTFAGLLLISGRLSDLYNPKWVFMIGACALGIFALVAGFIRSEIPLLVLRALMGAGGSLNIPAAMHIIVHMYQDPVVQGKAVTVFSAMGAVGMVLGLVIGALFVSFATWPWIFYFTAILGIFIGAAVFVLIPNISRTGSEGESRAASILRFRRLDLVGVALFTVSLILFIFAVTSGSVSGWGSAKVIAPLVISVVCIVVFFIWEAYLPESYAAVPPKMWRYKNFTILILISLLPYMFWSSAFLLYAWFWELVYGWSAIDVAAHFLPICLGTFLVVPVAASLHTKLRVKWVIFIGFVLLVAGCILLHFADAKDKYWPFAFPGFLLGTAGASMVFSSVSIALFATTPPAVSGIVTALFQCMLQTGGALGTAIVTSIQTSVQETDGGPDGYQGRAAGVWFLVGIFGAMGLVFLVCMKDVDVDGSQTSKVAEDPVEK